MRPLFSVAVIWFADASGQRILTGGLTRWCRDIAELLSNKGYDVTIYQKASTTFELSLSPSIRLIGLKANPEFDGNLAFARQFARRVGQNDPVLYVSQELAIAHARPRSVAVNHGIWWDGDFPAWKKVLIKALHRRLLSTCRGVVCVDTSYINWCHTELPHRASWESKLFYIPNYADANLYAPRARTEDTQSVHIVFPRRISEATLARQGRGAGLLLDAVEILIASGFSCRVSFIGPNTLAKEITAWADRARFADKIHISEVDLDAMPDVYAQADVVVVPSLCHEGTSLSAIEAMLCGRPTVVTHIGGLCNIVIDGLNGYVCDLTPHSLAAAIQRAAKEQCLNNSAIRDSVRVALGKDRWEASVWAHVREELAL